MEYNTYVKLFIINFIFYTISFLLIFSNQHYSAVNISSPLMITLTNICLFVMTSSLISLELVDHFNLLEEYKRSFNQIIPFLFIIGYCVIFISLILRMKRILQCLNLNKIVSMNIKNKSKIFYSRRFALDERFYCKVITIIIMLIMLLVGFFYWKNGGYIPVPFYFMKYFTNTKNEYNISNNLINKICVYWTIIYFIEGIILITYIYKLMIANLIKQIQIEFILQNIFYFITFISSRYYYKKNINDLNNNFNNTSLSFIIISFIYVFLNTYLPIARAIVDKIKINYSFNPKLVTNLYLFLSDEICYYSFSDFLKDSQIDSYFINLYTKIMKYKYKYSLEANFFNVTKEAKSLYKNYFDTDSENNYINEDILKKIRNNCSKYISKDDCTYEMFDDALVSVYEYLKKRFIEFRKSDEYKLLVNNLNMNSYIQYKMCLYSKIDSIKFSS